MVSSCSSGRSGAVEDVPGKEHSYVLYLWPDGTLLDPPVLQRPGIKQPECVASRGSDFSRGHPVTG